MRPIEFRAWGIDGTIGPKMWSWDHIKTVFDLWLLDESAHIMQFTGLLDKNGRKIWESDWGQNQFGEVGQIVFTNGAFWLKYIKPYDWDCMCPAELLDKGNQFEVIGNIYENPELLKEQP